MNKLLLSAVLLAGTALVAPASAATTASAIFTSDHCTGGCGNGSATGQPGGFATITGTDAGNGTIGINITLNNGNTFSGGGFPVSFGFNLVGNPTITYSGLGTQPFEVTGGTGTGGLVQNAGSLHEDGFGTFEYGVDYTGHGSSGNPPSALSFIISGAGLSLASFAELSTGGSPAAFFVLDIFSGTTGKTGLVDCCTGQLTPFVVQTPIPPALPLFIAGVVGIGMLKRVSKRLKGNDRSVALAA